jgi:hypothetical protein
MSSRDPPFLVLAGPRIVTIDQLAVDTIEASVGVGVDGTPSA